MQSIFTKPVWPRFTGIIVCVFMFGMSAVPTATHAREQALFQHLQQLFGLDAVAQAWQQVFGVSAAKSQLAQVGSISDTETAVYLDPAEVSLAAGEEARVEVRISPGSDHELTAVSLDLTFDVEFVDATSITSVESPFSTVLLEPVIDEAGGDITATLGVPVGVGTAIIDDALVAILTITAVAPFEGAPVAFTEATVASALGESSNVISERVPESTTYRTYGGESDEEQRQQQEEQYEVVQETPENGPATEEAATHLCSGDGELVSLVNLLLAMGTIPAERAVEACTALASLDASTVASNATDLPLFTRPLALGDDGEDVRRLQVFLNEYGFGAYATGPGSPGNETTYFGQRTLAGVRSFQSSYALEILRPVGLTTPSGYFGPSSIRKANEILTK